MGWKDNSARFGVPEKERRFGVQALPARAQAPLQPRLTRDDFINHILMMKQTQPDYAREALKSYDKAMPWLDLMAGVRQALEQQ